MLKKIIVFLLVSNLISCSISIDKKEISENQNTTEFKKALQKHLDAITNKNIEIVKSTLPPPNESMILILPDGTKMNTAGEFIKMHAEWFKETASQWKLIFDIKHTYTNKNMGYAIVEALLTEPERNGKPYFHKMHVSYVLEKKNTNWLVIKDHASSIDKTK